MKKLPLILILLALLQVTASAQNGDTLKKVCEYKDFPIGAMRNQNHDTLEKMFGMNFSWFGWDKQSAPNILFQNMPDNQNISFVDPFYYDPDTTAVHYTSGNLFSTAAYGRDVRVYMPGTSGITSEYKYRWSNKTGGLDAVHSRPVEWKIDTAGHQSGDTLLFDLGAAKSDPYNWEGTATGPFSYEFVYFFDKDKLDDISSGTTPLYTLEYWVQKRGGSSVLYATDTITKNSYNALGIAKTQVPGRDVGAENLFNWSGVSKNNQYKIQKRLLRIDTFFVVDAKGNHLPPEVDVRLRTFQQIPIFVRLLRIRDWRAQQLLSGKADTAMKNVITTLRNMGDNGKYKAWGVGNEPFAPSFHCFVYLHELFMKYGGKPLTTLAPWDHDLFIRVERDQSENKYSGDSRMYIWHEWVAYQGAYWRYMDAGKLAWDADLYPTRPLMPSTFSTSPSDSADWFRHAVFFESNYDTYTNHWQNTVIGFPSVALGGGSGFMKGLLDISKSCYEIDPLHPLPYWGCYQAACSPIHGVSLWALDSEKTALGKSDAWADSVYEARIINPYFARHNYDHNSTIEADSIYHLWWDWRASTEAEIRFQLWEGICGGLKGYNVNVALEDRGYNDGILWDVDTGIVKSYNRNEMRLDNFTDGSGKLKSPYADRYFRHDTAYKIKSKLLPAFKGMYNGVRNAVVNEIGPIAVKLGQLNWKGLLSWYQKDSAVTYLNRLPLKNLHSKSLTGTIDPDTATYVDIGVFKHPIDSIPIYVSVVNRRFWTDEKDTLTKDYRTITFQVDSAKFSPNYKQFTLWRISDVSNKLNDTVITAQDTFSFTVKPGQGKLFRIAPAVGLTLGEMSTNVFNNSRHIAPMEQNKDSVKGYALTYEKGGKIYVSYPSETPTGASKRTAGSPVDTLIASDTIYSLQTPAIAFDSASGKIGLVYCGIKPGAHDDDTAKIFFKAANFSNKKIFGNAISLVAPFQVPKGYTPAPSIMPTNRGDGKNFWIGWTDTTHGGVIAIINNAGAIQDTTFFHVDHPRYAGFVSLAAHKKFTNTVQIAYQESDEGLPNIGWLSHIFYLSASFNSGANLLTAIKPRNISADFTHCKNIYPQISLTSRGIVDVTWEVIKGSFHWGDRQTELLTHMTVFRNRNIKGVWGKSLTAFTFDRTTSPVISKDSMILYPNILHSDIVDPNLSSWSSIYRLMWNDPKTNSAAMAIFGRTDTSGGAIFSRGWETYTLVEQSVEPSLPHLSVGERIVQPVMYRSPNRKESGYYDARITQYDFPKTSLATAAISKKSINVVRPPDSNATTIPDCKAYPYGAFTTPFIVHDTVTTQIAFRQAANSGIDSTLPDTLGWNDNQNSRTESFFGLSGDTIQYKRYFRIGDDASDIAAAATDLTDSNDYLKIRILMRNTSNNVIRCVLDSSILRESGFTHTDDTTEGGSNRFIIPFGISDSVYLSLEASHGDALNTNYTPTQIEFYGDTTAIDLGPDQDSVDAYKKSALSPLSQPDLVMKENIKISVSPNPFELSTKISIDVQKNIPLNVSLYDVLGKLTLPLYNNIANMEHYDFVITKGQISPGTYFLRVLNGAEVVTRKIQLVK